MKAPWPKFSTSIMPNTSVSPEAMVKIIMPIARPAAVSVTKVEGEPTKGAATSGDDERRQRRQDVDLPPRQGGADVERAH